MRERPILFSAPMVRAILAGTKTQTRRAVKGWPLEWLSPPISFSPEYVANPENHACPYGQPGGRLWVREAWRASPMFNDKPPRELPGFAPLRYEADNTLHGAWAGYGLADDGKYRPPMFMPRWASRLTLTLTDVRVERLQAISEADALAEGIAGHPDGPWHAYRSLWTLINGPGSWDANPWVWVVEFRRAPAGGA